MLLDVGASRRLDETRAWVPGRHGVDLRLLVEYREGKGQIPKDEAAVGGYPSIKSAAPYADTDHDGMPNVWEAKHSLAPDSPDDGPTDADGDGYTNVEEFVNGTDPHEPE